MIKSIFNSLIIAGCFFSCNAQKSEIPPITQSQFSKQWYQGLAEVTSYDLQQARYGEIHPGDAVLIFVTEDFSKKKQVKLDNPKENPADAITVLKMNAMRQFNTGVYNYSMMQSVFTPVSRDKYPKSLKLSTSVQDWCGHAFMQYNLEGDHYRATQLSYFESEGDKNIKVEADILEDEIWTLIRIAPDQLPIGRVNMIPGSFFNRLRHNEGSSSIAEIKLEHKDAAFIYTVYYPNLDRTLRINFEDQFPYAIKGWEEESVSGFGSNKKMLVTTATRKKSLMFDYWTKHDLKDVAIRAELGL